MIGLLITLALLAYAGYCFTQAFIQDNKNKDLRSVSEIFAHAAAQMKKERQK